MATNKTDAAHRPPPYAQQVEHACQWSGFSRTRLEGLLRDGHIKAKREGRRTMVLTDSLRDYIDSLPNAW
jgi:hypothetical protein